MLKYVTNREEYKQKYPFNKLHPTFKVRAFMGYSPMAGCNTEVNFNPPKHFECQGDWELESYQLDDSVSLYDDNGKYRLSPYLNLFSTIPNATIEIFFIEYDEEVIQEMHRLYLIDEIGEEAYKEYLESQHKFYDFDPNADNAPF